MRFCGVLRRVGVGIAVAGVLASLTGCGTYLQQRGRDARQMVDIGITRSEKPCTAVFLCGVSLIGVGAGHFEGTFSGIGGNQVGTTKCYYRNRGLLLWTYEEIGWGDYDVTKQDTLYTYYGAILGWVQHIPRRPAYAPACNHFIHFGRRGVVFNFRYLEILDFLLGWTTLDLCGDDGDDPYGHWPWQAKGARNLPERFKFPD
jgi:hypothetical protein